MVLEAEKRGFRRCGLNRDGNRKNAVPAIEAMGASSSDEDQGLGSRQNADRDVAEVPMVCRLSKGFL
jgi:hypothetical protein